MDQKKLKAAYKNMVRRVEADTRRSEQKGLTNCYTCTNCGQVDKYLYVDSGTAPMVVGCSSCKKRSSFSSLMKQQAPNLAPTWEWFRPSLEQVKTFSKQPQLLMHILNGGLLRRPAQNPVKQDI